MFSPCSASTALERLVIRDLLGDDGSEMLRDFACISLSSLLPRIPSDLKNKNSCFAGCLGISRKP